MSGKSNKSDIKAVTILLAAVCAAVVVLFLLPCRFVSYSADDFGFMQSSQEVIDQNPGLSIFRVELHNAKTYYFGWQGCYTENIIVFFLMQLQHLGIRAFQVLIAADMLLFFSGMFFMLDKIGILLKTARKALLAAALFLLVILGGMNLSSPDEMFYWIDGSIAYTIPMAVGMFGIGFYALYLSCKKRTYAFFACLFGFIGCGGKLLLAAFLNASYLFLLLSTFFSGPSAEKSREEGHKDINGQNDRNALKADRKAAERNFLRYTVPFLVVFAGALVNALAPGNYFRHDQEVPDGFHVREVLVHTLVYAGRKYRDLFLHSYLLAACLIVILIVALTDIVRFRAKVNPFLVILYAFFTVYITIFPYALGYAEIDFMSNRVSFMVEIIVAMTTIGAALYTAQWGKQRATVRNSKSESPESGRNAAVINSVNSGRNPEHTDGKKDQSQKHGLKRRRQSGWLTVGIFLAVFLNILIAGVKDSNTYRIIRELSDGTMHNFYQTNTEILEEIANSPDEDVVIVRAVPHSDILKEIDLRDNPDYWANNGVALFYGKNSVTYIDPEPDAGSDAQ